MGLYQIHQTIYKKGTFVFKELNNTFLIGTVLNNRLKKFIFRTDYISNPQIVDPGDADIEREDPPQ